MSRNTRQPVRLTRRGDYAVLLGVLLGLTLLAISAYLCPVYVVVGK